MSIDIENCPFCGSSNIAVGYHGQPAQTFHMRCVSCGAAGPTVNSSLPTGGAFPANVCESWNRRATPQAPTPAAPEGQAEAEEWMRKAIAETRTAASLLNPGKFRGGMETACDEIETRMARDGDTLPRQAAVQVKDAKEIAISVAHEVLHHIDSMYPEMWKPVAKLARTSIRNLIIGQSQRFVAKINDDNAIEAARYRYIEDHASTDGGGSGFMIRCFVPVDHEDMGCGLDEAIATMATAPDQAKSAPATTEKEKS